MFTLPLQSGQLLTLSGKWLTAVGAFGSESVAGFHHLTVSGLLIIALYCECFFEPALFNRYDRLCGPSHARISTSDEDAADRLYLCDRGDGRPDRVDWPFVVASNRRAQCKAYLRPA